MTSLTSNADLGQRLTDEVIDIRKEYRCFPFHGNHGHIEHKDRHRVRYRQVNGLLVFETGLQKNGIQLITEQ